MNQAPGDDMMDVKIAHMEVLPGGTYFWTHWDIFKPVHSKLRSPLCEITDLDPLRLENDPGSAPKYGIGMAYYKDVCWILWAFDEEDVARTLSHEFMHCLLERFVGSHTAAQFESVSDMVDLGTSIFRGA